MLRSKWSQASERCMTTSQKPEKGCSKIIQRSFKSGLSYKYKITTKRGNYGTTPIWNPSWCFWNSSDSLTKRTKLRFGKQEGMKMFHLSVQVRHKIKPHPNLSWKTWKGQEPTHGTAQQATTLTENSHTTWTGAARQHARMWAQTKESSVSETRKQKVRCYFFTVVVLESVYGCFWNNGFIWGEFTMPSLKGRFWTSWAICIPCMNTENL